MKESDFHKKQLIYRLLVFYSFLIIQSSGSIRVQAQKPEFPPASNLQFNFVTYSVAEGLPNKYVYGFFQDRKNFIWIRTANGLSRYDGIEFQNFLHTSKDSNSIAGNTVLSMCEMPGDLIFIGTSNGLSIWNNRFNKFENWRITNKAIKPGNKIMISSLSLDTQKNLWLNFNGELDVYDSLFNFKFRYTDTEQGKMLKGIVSSEFLFDHQGNMWLMEEKFGLICIEKNSLKITYFNICDDPLYKKQAICGHYLDSSKSVLWYSPWGMGLYRYDLKTKKLKRFVFKDSDVFHAVQRNIINCILPHQHYLLCSSNNGLIVFNTEDESYYVMTHNNNNPFSLPDNGVASMIIDKDKLLWLATDNGICKSNLNKNLFGFYSQELKESDSGLPVEISHFTLFDTQWIIIGTIADGLYSYNLKTHEKKHYFTLLSD